MIDPGAAAGRSRPCSLHPELPPLYVESTMNQTGSKGTSVASADVMRAQASEWGPRNGGSMSKSLPSNFGNRLSSETTWDWMTGPKCRTWTNSHTRVEKIWQRGPIEAALKSASGASVVAGPAIAGKRRRRCGWRILGGTKNRGYDPGALAKASRASDERFARLTAIIQNFFGNDGFSGGSCCYLPEGQGRRACGSRRQYRGADAR